MKNYKMEGGWEDSHVYRTTLHKYKTCSEIICDPATSEVFTVAKFQVFSRAVVQQYSIGNRENNVMCRMIASFYYLSLELMICICLDAVKRYNILAGG